MHVLIAVTHLLGAGHLTRAAALARALADAGHDTVLVSGGAPSRLVRCGGARLVQLLPLRIAGTAFSRLLDLDGEPACPAHLDRRRTMLLDVLAQTAPDVVVTELFPFGRRALAAEFLALVEAARARRPRPLVLASLRDILVAPDDPERIAQAHARVADLYDAVLVHGDPALVKLDASWPLDSGTARRLRYTGYVDEGGTEPGIVRRAGVLVAAGSGAAGLGLFHAAAEAARIRPDFDWRLLVGDAVPDPEFRTVGRGLADGVVVRARPDYRALLAGAVCSVSQCGYNTAVDLLATGTPAVLVPFEAGGETEQRLRAEVFAARGLGRVSAASDLSAGSLIEAVTAALAAPRPGPHGVDLDGAARTVAIIEGLTGETESGLRHALSGHSAMSHRGLERGLAPAARSLEAAPESAEATRRDAVAGRVRGPVDAPLGVFDRLRAGLDDAAEAGSSIALWWRDDDAVAATPALERLLALAAACDAPLMIAAIPAEAEPCLGRRVAREGNVRLAVHGLAHLDHARAGDRPAEFGAHRPRAALVADAARGLALANRKFPPDRLLSVFVPPWNRLAPDLASALPGLGYRGLSAAGDRFGGPQIAGLVRADATLDPIDWRGTRSLRDPGALVDGLICDVAGRPSRPIGLLTHHRAHDESVWDFLGALLHVLVSHPAVRVLDPRHLFGIDAQPSSGISASVRVG